MHHEVRTKEIGPVAAGAIALTGSGEVELRRLEEFMLDMEPGIEGILRVLPDQSAEKIRPHSRMQILADLQCDFDFFRERRRNVLRDLIL